jgi:hypothetical protein
MDIAFALRRKRDEIATMISVYEDRIGAAKREMAALQQSARLFDPEGGGEDTVLHRELEGVRGQKRGLLRSTKFGSRRRRPPLAN